MVLLFWLISSVQQKSNLHVWHLHFNTCRDEHAQVADIFLKKGPYLKMYSTYIREFDKNVALLEEQCKRNPAFSAVVREFEVMRLDWPVFSLCVCTCVCKSHSLRWLFCCLLKCWGCVWSSSLKTYCFCSRPVLAVLTWLWSITYWSLSRGSLSTNSCSQVEEY